MENASKALLIAAAVLIVILLIAFGVGIFNSAQDAGSADEAAGSIKSGVEGASTNLNTTLQGIDLTKTE